MKEERRLRFEILESRGSFYAKEDAGEMEYHKAIDYLIRKDSNRSKLEKVFIQFFAEMREEENRINREKQI